MSCKLNLLNFFVEKLFLFYSVSFIVVIIFIPTATKAYSAPLLFSLSRFNSHVSLSHTNRINQYDNVLNIKSIKLKKNVLWSSKNNFENNFGNLQESVTDSEFLFDSKFSNYENIVESFRKIWTKINEFENGKEHSEWNFSTGNIQSPEERSSVGILKVKDIF